MPVIVVGAIVTRGVVNSSPCRATATGIRWPASSASSHDFGHCSWIGKSTPALRRGVGGDHLRQRRRVRNRSAGAAARGCGSRRETALVAGRRRGARSFRPSARADRWRFPACRPIGSDDRTARAPAAGAAPPLVDCLRSYAAHGRGVSARRGRAETRIAYAASQTNQAFRTASGGGNPQSSRSSRSTCRLACPTRICSCSCARTWVTPQDPGRCLARAVRRGPLGSCAGEGDGSTWRHGLCGLHRLRRPDAGLLVDRCPGFVHPRLGHTSVRATCARRFQRRCLRYSAWGMSSPSTPPPLRHRDGVSHAAAETAVPVFHPRPFQLRRKSCGIVDAPTMRARFPTMRPRSRATAATKCPCCRSCRVDDVRVVEWTGGTKYAAFTVSRRKPSAATCPSPCARPIPRPRPAGENRRRLRQLMPIVRTIAAARPWHRQHRHQAASVSEGNEHFDLVLTWPVGATIADGFTARDDR